MYMHIFAKYVRLRSLGTPCRIVGRMLPYMVCHYMLNEPTSKKVIEQIMSVELWALPIEMEAKGASVRHTCM